MNFKMIYSTSAIILGIFIASLFNPGNLYILFGFIILFIFFYLSKELINIKIFFIIAILFLLSIYRYTSAINYENNLKKYENTAINANVIILQEISTKDNMTSYIAECRGIFTDKGIEHCKEKLIYKDYKKSNYKPGDAIEIRGIVEKIIGKRNFGDKDFALYYKSKGIYEQIGSYNSKKVGVFKDHKIFFFYSVRNKISHIISDALPKDEAAFLNAVIIGDKHYLKEEVRDSYMKTGLAHILSVSGLHIGFIFYLINNVLILFKLKTATANVLSSFLLIYYVLMIGAPPPAVRALIMMLVLIWGKHLKRDYDIKASTSFAASVMLLYNPLFIHDQGFIISFACIYSIAFLYETIFKLLGKIIRILPIRNAIALSLSVQVGIMPILIYYFNYFSIITVFINIIVVPLVFLVIAIAFIAVLISIIIPPMGVYVFSLDYYFISILSKIISLSASSNISGLSIPSLPLFIYFIYYLFLIMLIITSKDFYYYLIKYKKTFVAIFLSFSMLFFSYRFFNKDIKLTFLDVGQGDSSLITTVKGKKILIDGGGSSSVANYYYDVGGKITVPALLKLGVWSIDTIVVTHIHEDHLEGLLKVIENFKVGKVILPDTPYKSAISNKFLMSCKEKRIGISYIKEGDKLFIDKDTEINFVFPEKELIKGSNSDENNNSIVARLIYRNFKVLYTADIEKEAESRLINKDIKADVLKVAHHGSKTSSTSEFINKVGPKISIISVGKNNFGHPNDEVIERLKNMSDLVFRTDKNGAISLKTNGKRVIIKSVREPDKK